MILIFRKLGRFTLNSRAAYSLSNIVNNGKPPPLPRFDPVSHGLNADFVLTNFTKMKG
jgi:hypothetical protein